MLVNIPVDRIEFDDGHPDLPPLDPKFCARLARSIDHDGLLHPPLVLEGEGGQYRILAGRKRIFAMARVLGLAEVECRVVRDLDADRQESATLAENLFRVNPSGAPFRRALARWHELYDAAHPVVDRRRSKAARREARERIRQAEERAGGPLPPEEARAIAESVHQEARSFVDEVMEVLGLPRRTASRLARVAEHLAPEQIDVLARSGIKAGTYEAIAALPDPTAVTRCVNLIASGLGQDDAVRLARDAPRAAAATAPTAPAAATAAPAPPAPPVRAEEMPDEDWLAAFCPRPLAALRRQGPFRRDAILYRRIEPHVRKLAKAVAAALDEARSDDGNGMFFASLYRVTRALHPALWPACSACDGTGIGPEPPRRCERCYGTAYALRLEE